MRSMLERMGKRQRLMRGQESKADGGLYIHVFSICHRDPASVHDERSTEFAGING